MPIIKSFHLIALVLFALYGLLSAHSLRGEALIYWAALLIYGGLWCGLLQDNIWCARLLILPPLAIIVFTAPMVLYNCFAFVTGDPRYLDSPATIIIVAIFALFTTVPSTVVLWAYWYERRQIFSSKRA